MADFRVGTLDNNGEYTSELCDTKHLLIAEYPSVFRKEYDEIAASDGARHFARISPQDTQRWEQVGVVEVPVYRLTAQGRRELAQAYGIDAANPKTLDYEKPKDDSVDIFRASGYSKEAEDLTNRLLATYRKNKGEGS